MRVLAHAHSTWSYDGRLTLEEWVAEARAHQCDAILLTEHEQESPAWTAERYQEYRDACADASTDEVRLLPGIEFNERDYHLLAFDLHQYPPRPSSLAELAAQIHAQGSLLCLAHPGRYSWKIPPAILDAVDAIEVWNSKWFYDGDHGPHPRALTLAPGKIPLVGQDAHKPKHFTAVYLETETSDILADLRARRYTITNGQRHWNPDALPHGLSLAMYHAGRDLYLQTGRYLYRLFKYLFRHAQDEE